MPARRLSMRKIKEVLRLKWEVGVTDAAVSRSCHVARSTVADCIHRAQVAGLVWPLPDDMNDTRLEALLYPPPVPSSIQRPMPDWSTVHQDMKGKKVTLFLLWQEYKADHPDGFQYSRFSELYRIWRGKLTVSMRQTHKAGEKMFVDYAGPTIPIVDRATGAEHPAQVFVAVLGASSYTYAEATMTQGLPDWIGSHVRTFEFFGGVPEIVVPDNLKSGVTKPCRYDPEINPGYADLARHYGIAVIPARVRKPKDKAKAEGGVLVVERWIMAALRNRTFFSLAEANAAIKELLTKLNDRPFKKLTGCRRSQFEELDKPALKALPDTAYEYAEWKQARVGIDYHVDVGSHYYSVPYQLIKQQLDIRITHSTVECFHKGKRVAAHVRVYGRGHTTINEHMPKAHQSYAQWTPERIIRWSRSIGEQTAVVANIIISRRHHPQQGFRACMGLMSMGKKYSNDRLEAACNRAIVTNCVSYKSIKSILKTGLDRQPLLEMQATEKTPDHGNIRGPQYFH
ncbi:MAG: IS21 family transposase [Mariprofundaceae bacterium]|nr:IS21 family transposase [Mariprofundaceae bacterium]